MNYTNYQKKLLGQKNLGSNHYTIINHILKVTNQILRNTIISKFLIMELIVPKITQW